MRTEERGVTYLEMVATAAIVMIFASAVIPLTRITHRRLQELELRRSLREVRGALDAYNRLANAGGVCGTDLKLNNQFFPADLETLVKGITRCGGGGTPNGVAGGGPAGAAGGGPGGAPGAKVKFLRHIPVDPMTGKAEWGLRCVQDDADSDSWCGDNVWDIYSKSQGKALDGTKYRDW